MIFYDSAKWKSTIWDSAKWEWTEFYSLVHIAWTKGLSADGGQYKCENFIGIT